jgi:hypothetical protein
MLKRKGAYMVGKYPWCVVFGAPRSLEHCVVAQRIPKEEEKQYHEEEEDHTICMTSQSFFQEEREYSSSKEGGYEYDVRN